MLLVYPYGARALSLKDGRQAWARMLGAPSGQGAASGNVYYLPLKNGIGPDDPPEVCAINVDSGEMHHTRSRKKDVPGNLVFYEGKMLSQKPN